MLPRNRRRSSSPARPTSHAGTLGDRSALHTERLCCRGDDRCWFRIRCGADTEREPPKGAPRLGAAEDADALLCYAIASGQGRPGIRDPIAGARPSPDSRQRRGGGGVSAAYAKLASWCSTTRDPARDEPYGPWPGADVGASPRGPAGGLSLRVPGADPRPHDQRPRWSTFISSVVADQVKTPRC
jgi:hypothetical protein